MDDSIFQKMTHRVLDGYQSSVPCWYVQQNTILGIKAKAFLDSIISEENTYSFLQFLNCHKETVKKTGNKHLRWLLVKSLQRNSRFIRCNQYRQQNEWNYFNYVQKYRLNYLQILKINWNISILKIPKCYIIWNLQKIIPKYKSWFNIYHTKIPSSFIVWNNLLVIY